MTRGLLAVGVAAACASTPSPPSESPRPALEDLLIGRWEDGPGTLELRGDQSFSWALPVACRFPPCPLGAVAGRWAIDSGGESPRLVLHTPDGPWRLTLQLGHGPRRLELGDQPTRRSWVLVFRN
jgi:hypothetical protein